MKGLIALVVFLSFAFVAVRAYERNQRIVLEKPANYAAAKTIVMPSQRDLVAELEMKLPPGLGTGSEIAFPAEAAPEVAKVSQTPKFESASKKRAKRGHAKAKRRHRRR